MWWHGDNINRNKFCNHRLCHDDVIKWKHFPRYWPFVRGIHRSPVNSPHKTSDAELWCFLWFALNKRPSKQSRRRWFDISDLCRDRSLTVFGRFPSKDELDGALIFSLLLLLTRPCMNTLVASDLRRHDHHMTSLQWASVLTSPWKRLMVLRDFKYDIHMIPYKKQFHNQLTSNILLNKIFCDTRYIFKLLRKIISMQKSVGLSFKQISWNTI